MKIELDIPAETLACLWMNTWGDRQPEPISQRVAAAINAAANDYYKAFPMTPHQIQMITDRFLASKAAQS